MATGRIRRTARRGLGLALVAWLGVAASSILLAPGAAAAPTATIEIRNVTPPVASVDSGGTVTFVNKIPAENRGGISIPLPLGTISVGATVYTDVSLSFFGQQRNLQPEQSASWKFTAPATTGMITYTYRVVPQAQLPLGVSLQQVVDRVLGSLPALPAPTPYIVQTIAPDLPNLPSVGVPQLPQVNVPVPQLTNPIDPRDPVVPPTDGPAPAPAPEEGPAPDVADVGNAYEYPLGGGLEMGPGLRSAIAAFDPARFGAASGGFAAADRAGAGTGSGSGGVAGSYDGASVPVFGQLAGLDGTTLDEESAETVSASEARPVTLPAAALAAVVALAAVTAALVRTHQAAREDR
ncbi:hypothetical protein GCU60_04020 [Blastococcus saxobsidens]|uniref:Uncharacterized protein n=1 Tax=Blastococcus saxobsidens TaxID=138336 RepID=A0A6L9W0B1_9ACTN|nr:hypothetical protein [Blastococcus saxobsidens]NEK84931.1 hypothetical protein [Blastococcus saxobsidens]